MINVIKNMIAILDVFKIYNPAYMNLYSSIFKGYSLKLPAEKKLNNKPADKLRNQTDYNANMQDIKTHNPDYKFNGGTNIVGYISGGDKHIINEPDNILKDNYYFKNTAKNYNLNNINVDNKKIISNIRNIYSPKASINNSYNSLYSYKNFRNHISNINYISNSNNRNSETYIPNNTIKYEKILGDTVDVHTINYNNKLGNTLDNTSVIYNNYIGDVKQTSIHHLSNTNKKFSSNNYNREDYNNYNNSAYSKDINNNHIDIDKIIQLLQQELLRELNSSTKGVY